MCIYIPSPHAWIQLTVARQVELPGQLTNEYHHQRKQDRRPCTSVTNAGRWRVTSTKACSFRTFS